VLDRRLLSASAGEPVEVGFRARIVPPSRPSPMDEGLFVADLLIMS
jgi:hypothetical protein